MVSPSPSSPLATWSMRASANLLRLASPRHIFLFSIFTTSFQMTTWCKVLDRAAENKTFLDAILAPPILTGAGKTSANIFVDGNNSRVSFLLLLLLSLVLQFSFLFLVIVDINAILVFGYWCCHCFWYCCCFCFLLLPPPSKPLVPRNQLWESRLSIIASGACISRRRSCAHNLLIIADLLIICAHNLLIIQWSRSVIAPTPCLMEWEREVH